MWWDSDDKPKGAVGKGQEAEDEIFREAEKLGIDIRTHTPDLTQGGSSQSHSVTANSSGAKSMTFGFFDFPAAESEVGADGDQAITFSHNEAAVSYTSSGGGVFIDPGLSASGLEEATRVLELLDLKHILSLAKSFCRDRYVYVYLLCTPLCMLSSLHLINTHTHTYTILYYIHHTYTGQ